MKTFILADETGVSRQDSGRCNVTKVATGGGSPDVEPPSKSGKQPLASRTKAVFCPAGIPAEAILLLECTSGRIDQLRLAHRLGDKRRVLQLGGQCIAGISAHHDEWYPAPL